MLHERIPWCGISPKLPSEFMSVFVAAASCSRKINLNRLRLYCLWLIPHHFLQHYSFVATAASAFDTDDYSRSIILSSPLLLPEVKLSKRLFSRVPCWLLPLFDLTQLTKRYTTPFSFRNCFRRSFLIRWTTSHISSSNNKGALQMGHSVLFLLSNHENKHSPWKIWEHDLDRNTESVGSYSTRQIEQTGPSSEHAKDVLGDDFVPNFVGVFVIVLTILQPQSESCSHRFLSSILPHSTSTVFSELPRSSSTALRRSSLVIIRIRCGSSSSFSSVEFPKRRCSCRW